MPEIIFRGGMSVLSEPLRHAIEEAAMKIERESYRRGFLAGYRAGAKMLEGLSSDDGFIRMMMEFDLAERGIADFVYPEPFPDKKGFPTAAVVAAAIARSTAPPDEIPGQVENSPTAEATAAAGADPPVEENAAPRSEVVQPETPAPPATQPHRCCAALSLPFPTQCSRPGVVERGGKLYCAQHDPERVPPVPRPAAAWRTDGRRDLLKALYPGERSVKEIWRELQALDGENDFGPEAMATWANDLGLRRQSPPKFGSHAKVNGASDPQFTEASFGQIEHWAATRGLQFTGKNLGVINAKALALGRPPFKLKNDH